MIAPVSAALLGLLLAPDGSESELSLSARGSVSDGAEPWIRRHRPRRNMFHLGVFGGVMFPARDIELFEVDTADADQGFRSYDSVAPEFGGRFGFFPLDFLGLEVEGAVGLGRVEGDQSATLWAARGHVIGQVPRWSVTPFVLAGAGALGVRSGGAAVGNDTDLAFHLGGGVMVHVTQAISLRLDLRNTITPQQGPNGGSTNNPEILFGIGWTRRPRREPEPEPAPEPSAEPPPPPVDSDGDGFIDDEDGCPEQQGVAPDGCPEPPPAEEAALDTDGDGIPDDADACVSEPETINAYQDADGCPDELPQELGAFEGTLEGVTFNVDSADLRPGSRRKLDDVVAVMAKYPQIRVEISGHTDSSGALAHNMELSKARADSVKAYLVEHGVAGDRIETRGAGPDEPVDTNANAEGRAHNRRIEVRLLNCSCGG